MNAVMKRILFAILVFLPSAAIADDDDDAAKLTMIDCSKQADHSIADNNGKYEFTGACGAVSVTGNDNTLTIEKAKSLSLPGNKNAATVGMIDRISVVGNDNTVKWKKGLSKAKPKISVVGNHNKVSKAK